MTLKSKKGFTLIELLIVVAVIGIIAAIAVPSLLNAIDRGKQKRTMADMRSMGTAIAAYSIDAGFFPRTDTVAEMQAQITPLYIRTIPVTDGWEQGWEITSYPTQYTLASCGKGETGACTSVRESNPATTQFIHDIIMNDGVFTQWPKGKQS